MAAILAQRKQGSILVLTDAVFSFREQKPRKFGAGAIASRNRKGKDERETMIERAQQSAAKIFGVTYLLGMAILMVVFSRFYAPYMVWESGEETARHFLLHEDAIRIYLAGAFVFGVGMIVLLSALYVLLRPVNRGIALCAAFSRVIYAAFWFIFIMDMVGALRFLGGAGALRGFGQDGLVALAGAQLGAGRDAYYIGLAFNGLGSALFAWVLFQSRYIPRALALWGVLGAIYEGLCGFAYLLYPGFGAIHSPNWYELPPMTFDLLLCFWLLFRGVKSPEMGLAPASTT
jgi:hypothetical protein